MHYNKHRSSAVFGISQSIFGQTNHKNDNISQSKAMLHNPLSLLWQSPPGTDQMPMFHTKETLNNAHTLSHRNVTTMKLRTFDHVVIVGRLVWRARDMFCFLLTLRIEQICKDTSRGPFLETRYSNGRSASMSTLCMQLTIRSFSRKTGAYLSYIKVLARDYLWFLHNR